MEEEPQKSIGHKCSLCDKSFRHTSGLYRHRRMVHPQAGRNESLCLQKYSCNMCDKQYRHITSLYNHKKAAHASPPPEPLPAEQQHPQDLVAVTATAAPSDNTVVLALLSALQEQTKTHTDYLEQQNRELTEMLRESATALAKQNSSSIAIADNSTNNNNSSNLVNHSNNTTNNSHSNNQFNLQFFLNETCKNAMNIDQFVESIKVELSDLENIGRIGYVDGISSLIISKLKSLDITERPIHCTDKKREVIYVKKPELWEKETEKNPSVREVIRKVRTKNREMLPVFKQLHPDCIRSSSRFADQYNEMIMEVTNPETDNHDNKIIRRICENVTINKT